jgi:hypothetical protein
MEEEAAALRDMQAKVEKEMSAVQGTCLGLWTWQRLLTQIWNWCMEF